MFIVSVFLLVSIQRNLATHLILARSAQHGKGIRFCTKILFKNKYFALGFCKSQKLSLAKMNISIKFKAGFVHLKKLLHVLFH